MASAIVILISAFEHWLMANNDDNHHNWHSFSLTRKWCNVTNSIDRWCLCDHEGMPTNRGVRNMRANLILNLVYIQLRHSHRLHTQFRIVHVHTDKVYILYPVDMNVALQIYFGELSIHRTHYIYIQTQIFAQNHYATVQVLMCRKVVNIVKNQRSTME